MKIHIGVDQFPLFLSRIRKSCDVAEVSSFRTTLPRKKTLAHWQDEAPKGFRHVIPAPFAITDPSWEKTKPTSWREGAQGFKAGAELEYIWKSMDKAAGILRASTMLFQTRADFRPTKQNKDAMGAFFDSRPRKNYKFVWEPSGLWEPEEALVYAEKHNLFVAQDPLSDAFEPTDDSFRYFRVKNLRSGTGITEMGFEEIYEAAQGAQRVFVIFCTHKPIADARRFRAFLSEQ